MKNPKEVCCTLIFLFACTSVSAQMNGGKCQDLRSRFTPMQTDSLSPNKLYHIETNGNRRELNYVTPLRRIFLNKANYSFEDGSWQELTSLFSMVGAHQDVMALTEKFNEFNSKDKPKDNPATLSDTLDLIDCNSLLEKIKFHKVIMINEAHDQIQPRAFILSLLPKLKLQGFTHLAMETLNYFELNKVSLNTGFYTSEPMFGEVVREALKLGFALVPYEDTNARNHSNSERELAQATNLTNAINTAPQHAKFFVIAGYAHIAEDIPDEAFSTMAMQFKKMSGIDPFTIDQVTGLENNDDNNGRLIRRSSKKGERPQAVVNSDGVISIDLMHYDAFIIHPATKLINCRPDWLAANGMKVDVKVRCTNEKSVLIQAYYKSEINSGQSYKVMVPADQTFYLDANGFAHLFLIPGSNYVIVFRDENNNIIQTQKIKV